MNKKTLLIISLIIIILVSIITNIYIISKDNKDKTENTKPQFLQEITYKGLKISNASIETGNDLSEYKSMVTNISDNTIKIDKLYIIFYNNDQENKILALSNIELSQNENTVIDIVSEDDLNKITDIKFVLE